LISSGGITLESGQPWRWVACGAIAVTGLFILAAAPPSHGAVTIGEDTTSPGTASFMSCSGFSHHSCTFAQTTQPNRSYTAPFGGVIVRWRIRGDSKGLQFSLRVIRRNEDGTFTGMGTSEPTAVMPGIENVFSAQLPIAQGDLIGLNVPGGAGNPQVERRPVPGATFSTWFYTPLQDGETRAPEGSGSNALVYNADIEPDCDQDGLGDETQDSELPLGAACGKGNRALTLDANKNKVKKRKKVTLSGRLAPAARQGPCESGQTVELQRKRPSQSTFTTFASVQTDAQGSFSLKTKVKKTLEYRAQVVETAACTAALSNTEKVKVKKKK
jgi:hypothetical protein